MSFGFSSRDTVDDDAPATAPATDAHLPQRAQRSRRADARHNHDKLLAAAREALGAHGGGFAMDAVAKRAGVGAGTLYRHFPTRDALVEAVYAAELEDLADSARVLLAERTPSSALREWLARYARFTATKRGMMETLRAGTTASRAPMSATRERITAAIALLLEAGATDGSLRADLLPDDVTALLHGVFVATARSTDSTDSTDAVQVARLLDLVMDALRARA